MEGTLDGGVLEISIDGGVFQDILTAGGSFVGGGYNKTINLSFQSPIGGRMAWSGNSDGYITTTVNLPPAAAGKNIVLRFRMGSDNSAAVVGWHIDSIEIDSQDRDGDGVADSVDNCPDDFNPGQEDADGDGVGDACDGCPNDRNKTAPGICGCGVAETDTDTDGTPDCVDECPENPNLIAPRGCGGCGGACGMGMAVSTPLTLLALQLQRRRGARRSGSRRGRAG